MQGDLGYCPLDRKDNTGYTTQIKRRILHVVVLPYTHLRLSIYIYIYSF